MSKLTTASHIAKLKAQIKKLEAKANIITARNQSKALAKIIVLAKSSELTIAQVQAALRKGTREGKVARVAKPARKPAQRSSILAGRKIAPKYRNPSNKQETWAGRGRAPKWAEDLRAADKLDTALIHSK